MPNVKNIIQSHNKRVLNPANTTEIEERTCNCRSENCPVDGACLKKNVIYEAKVESRGNVKFYIGSTGNTFKSRYGTHKSSFNNRGTCETELSKHIWSLKDTGTDYRVSWKIIRSLRGGGGPISGICSTCKWGKDRDSARG